jgi:periplasmic divalent cation tolerance protein
MSEAVVVGMVTCGSLAEARRIARAVLEPRLAACVNIVGPVESHYWWEGCLQQGRERLLLVKTTRRRVRQVIAAVRAAHSYEVPEIIFVPLDAGEGRYVEWIRDSVKS